MEIYKKLISIFYCLAILAGALIIATFADFDTVSETSETTAITEETETEEAEIEEEDTIEKNIVIVYCFCQKQLDALRSVGKSRAPAHASINVTAVSISW